MLPLRDRNPTRRTPVVTIVLIVVNVAVYFLLQQPQSSDEQQAEFIYEYAAIPCEVVTGEPLEITEIQFNQCVREDQPGVPELFPDKQVWLAVVFSMFFHGSLLHLGGNMLFLWIFGNNIEDHLGAVRYIGFYLVAGVVATLAHIAAQPSSVIPLVGASGAIAGVMGAYLVWFPRARILTLVFMFLLVEVQAMWVLGFWFVSQFFIAPDSGVAWMAHVGGFVFGVAIGLLVRRSVRARQLAWRNRYVRADPYHQRYGDYY
ncbi:MAG: rhomboid family intramembrane serine protease [Acidimicrobiales bacterium]